ncbi:F0F1 ATP synthase subunit B [Candidatus Dojkabacteria bacterium]|nr:F0F1 ATP synthase subunit B [Candidatus Dojkabacteria bacterium]
MSDILEKLTINPKILGFMILNFLVLVVALRFILLKPLTKAIKERQEKIGRGLDNAEKMEKKMAEFNENYEKKMIKVKEETKSILERAKQEGRQLREEELKKAKKDATALIEQAKLDIVKSKKELKQEVKEEIGVVMEEVFNRVLKTGMTKEQKEGLVKEAIKELEK